MFRFSMNWSEYAVKVWVVGPIGTEPIGTALRTEVEQQLSSKPNKPEEFQ
jgi:hypothetical protein